MDVAALAIVATVLGVAAAFAYRFVARRRAHEARSVAALSAPGDRVPRSLHPVFDTDLCIGSLSCVRSCPEGDIIGVVDGVGRLVHGEHCIGHGRCAAECPVSAIKLVFGTAERGVDLPEVDGFFESSRPGVHVVGELGGMGLIKNAMRQGLELAERLADLVPRGGREVVIVGGGPAGIATALGLKARGVPHRVLEQGKLGGSILHYPREKVVMTEPVELPLWGKFGRRTIQKEELLDTFHRIVDGTGVAFQEGVRVTGVDGEDGSFVVRTAAGDFPAAKVVLAAGRRGTPRRLGVPGEESPSVLYGLTDPEQFTGRRVLVVGGGDAAVEAALQLAGERAQVTLSYRGEALARCREENRSAIQAARDARQLELLLPSTVREVRREDVLLDVAGTERVIEQATVVVSIGGELPLEFLAKCGVALKRYHGDAPGSSSREWRERQDSARQRGAKRRERLVRAGLALLGVGVLAALAWVGREYYPLDRLSRRESPLHATLKSAGPWGHGVGIAATLFMLSNFLYAARKRWKRLDGLGGIRRWLDFHVFVGTMSPAVISFHAAFQAKNLLAIATAASLGVVFTTGIIGRFIYSVVPADGGKTVALEDLLATLERLRDRMGSLFAEGGPQARAIQERLAAPVVAGSMLLLFLKGPFEALALRLRLLALRRHFPDRSHYRELAAAVIPADRLRWQIRFYASLKRLLRGWRVFHATLAVFLVVAMALHIGVSLYLGYGIIK
jgi:thioredoxin reductase/Pyruvate/2-oxoacid:ferredoxin oxidoreductase delta subunit